MDPNWGSLLLPFLPPPACPLHLDDVRKLPLFVCAKRVLGKGSGRNDCKKALCAATKYMVAVVAIVALVTGILFAVLGKSDVPVKDHEVTDGFTKRQL